MLQIIAARVAEDSAQIDALFAGAGCQSVYIDVGTNIGVQLRKLFEPRKYPGAPALRVFDDVFGRDRDPCGVCAIGIEPNPHHEQRLERLERRLRGAQARVLVLRAAASDADSVTQLALEHRDQESTNKDVGATAAPTWAGTRAAWSAAIVDVRTVDLARVIARVHRNLQLQHGADRGESRILMKLDVEGAEYKILPHLALSQALCLVDRMFIETHPDTYGLAAVQRTATARHLHRREAGAAAASVIARASMQAVHEAVGARPDDCRLMFTQIDDEEYLYDTDASGRHVPWPTGSVCGTTNASAAGRRRRSRAQRRGSAALSLHEARSGYCGVTIDWEGDCALGEQGSWRAAANGIRSLRACAARCQRCSRCEFVSFSRKNDECGWFHECPLPLQMKFGGENWRSVQVPVNSTSAAGPGVGFASVREDRA